MESGPIVGLMEEEVYLRGRVRRQSLPLLPAPADTEAPVLKRLDLTQGILAQISPADIALRYIAWAELRQGKIRGNHYHHRKLEWLYLIEGEVELIVEDRETKAREVVMLVTGDLAVIETGIAHALRPLRSGQCLEYSPQPFDPSDSEHYAVI